MKADLRKRLEELHAELETLDQVDDATRAQLRQLAEELQPYAQEEEEPDSLADDLVDRWNEAVHRFESEYPTLARAVSRISHVLAQMGF